MTPVRLISWSFALLTGSIVLIGLNHLLYNNNDKTVRRTDIYKIIATPRLKEVKETSYLVTRLALNNSPPGHMGSAVTLDLSNREVESLVERSIQRHGFNGYASSLIPLRRVLPDLRDVRCVRNDSDGHLHASRLPKTSIVIVFYNEQWSVLLRTVHSVLDNTPAHLIDEILLVDDFSYLPHLKTELEEYLRPYANVRIIRAPERLGLIRARIFGAKNTTSSLLTFLDAHVECTTGWLEPLLAEVVKNDTTIAVPLIDRIDDNDMHVVVNVSAALLGAFQWDLNFGWWYRSTFPGRPQPGSAPAEPFETPAMAGGIFTIARSFFVRLGWYDERFQVYGMENTELSVKGWMCGGRILTVPCAHVAHIRKRAHPFFDDAAGRLNVTFLNSIRVAEVWMDEYRQVVYDVNGIPGYREELFGSVADRKATRVRAECRSFRYYLQRAYREMPSPVVPGQFRGEVHNVALGNGTCLTARNTNQPPFMAACDKRNETQFWTHNFYQELNSYKRCIDVTASGIDLTHAQCHRMRGTQAWHHDVESAQIRSIEHQTCLAVDTTNKSGTLKLEPCAERALHQQWYVTLTSYEFWKPFQ